MDVADHPDYSTQLSGADQEQAMRQALEAIQELHEGEIAGFSAVHGTLRECRECDQKWPCKTRKLADEGLAVGGGERG